jgi:hypothetical protein
LTLAPWMRFHPRVVRARELPRDIDAPGVMVAPARPPYRELLSGPAQATVVLLSVAGFAWTLWFLYSSSR